MSQHGTSIVNSRLWFKHLDKLSAVVNHIQWVTHHQYRRDP
jgi:hypothetical protein